MCVRACYSSFFHHWSVILSAHELISLIVARDAHIEAVGFFAAAMGAKLNVDVIVLLQCFHRLGGKKENGMRNGRETRDAGDSKWVDRIELL